MRPLWLITHADVEIDPDVPVPDWGLSAQGRTRHAALAETWAATRPGPDAIWSSAERKAREGADVLAKAFGMEVRHDAALGENDRSATGFILEPEFSWVAAEFFANPETSVRGWERAVDAQARITAAVDKVLNATSGTGEVAIVFHGAVATLLLCARLGRPISTKLSPGISGGGAICLLVGDRLTRDWRPIEASDALHSGRKVEDYSAASREGSSSPDFGA